VDVLTGDEVRAYVAANGTPAQKAMVGTANTDWQDVIFRKAYGQEYNLGMSGGLSALPYRFNFGFLNQEGILKTSKLERFTAALGLFPSFLDRHLNVTLNAKVSRSNSRFANEGAIGNATAFDPTQQVYQKNGPGGYFEWLDAATGLPNPLSNRNPLALLETNDNRSEVDRFLGNVQLDYKLHWFPDLRLNLNVGYDVQQGDGRTRIPAYAATQLTASGTPTNPGIRRFGTGDIYDQLNKNKLAEFFINYNKDVKSIRGRVDFTAGYSYQDFTYENNNYVPRTFTGQEAPTTTQPQYPKNFNQQTLLSYYGRLNFTLAERYTINATVRRDASSVFREDLRWGTFPAVGLTWNVKGESFLKDSKVLSDLKFRLGYGITGQQDIVGSVGYYPYIPGYYQGDSSSMYQFGNRYVSTFAPSPYNSNLKWEETETINAGLDFGILNGRVNGSIDLFRKTSRDLLANVSWALGTNFTNEFIRNIGSFEAKGLEIGVNANPVKNKNWNWNVGANATFLDREIKKLNDVTPKDFLGFRVGGISGGTGNRIQVHTVGYDPNSFFVYQQVYDAKGKPIEGLYVDQNGDGVINERDLYRYQKPAPSTQLGFNSNLGYKKLSLGFSMRANIGNYIYSNVNSGNVSSSITTPLNYIGNASRDVLNTNFKNNQYMSDYYIQNASFLKMDYISLGYNFGKLGKSKAGLRLSANIQNAFVVTKYQGLDPEHFNGIDNQLYPRPRIYSLGINLDY
jgi:TonB-dependent starch-binding outer membrane protein SusC